jgi:hypothetical protein
LGTYLGGTDDDEARGVAVGASGAIYVTGITASSDFPTTSGAYDETHNGVNDGFLTKIALAQVTESLVVGIPDGGETWCLDGSETLQWSSSGAGGAVNIELSRNGPDGTWETLYAATANDGSEAWTVSGAESSDCYIRVTDTSDGTLTDMTNSAFTITTCAPPPDPPVAPAGESGYAAVGYLSFVATNSGRAETALRVTLVDMPAPFESFEGLQMWVGSPVTKCENAGASNPPCPVVPDLPDEFAAANLQCTPHCMDFGSVGLLSVADDEVIPGATYDIQAIDCTADFGVEASYSEPLTISTSLWGDLVGNCTVIPCTPPDGVVNITTDVTSVLDKFKNLPGCVLKARADLEPNMRDWLVNITDVTVCLDAFLGTTFPPSGWAGPGGCP